MSWNLFALRAALENFGVKVDMHWIGRPNDLIHVLSGRVRGEIDYLLFLSFHGEEGAFIMPELGKMFTKMRSLEILPLERMESSGMPP
ncbi:hypothetical protein BsIDN1_46360 [Bacillus safensis]|uniref:Uncharacterized protein n=1 Tax=Bacillus safensis TaxID=561879 RepID=A0A5S9MDF5_BACIA|nr:hypothetical protein BsIDN1_46360 [Bacillus safensis]